MTAIVVTATEREAADGDAVAMETTDRAHVVTDSMEAAEREPMAVDVVTIGRSRTWPQKP